MVLKWIADRFKAAPPQPKLLAKAQALRMKDAFEAARALCMEVLREEPGQQAPAMALLAAIAADQRQVDSGLQWAQRALAADARCIPAHFAMGRLLETAERHADAESSYRRVTELDPHHAKGFTNLGCMLHIQGRLDEAARCYVKALELEPGQPEALRNHALIAGGEGQLQQAAAAFERHLAEHPGDASAHHQLAQLRLREGSVEEAVAGSQRAIALQPDDPEMHFALAQAQLLLGNYEDGWREYEWRWHMDRFNAPMRRFTQPRWDGHALEGRTLLVHGETGLGETFQLVRYAALAAQRGARVVVECQRPLLDLVARVEGVAQVVAQGDSLPAIDVHLPFIAFPGVFGTTLSSRSRGADLISMPIRTLSPRGPMRCGRSNPGAARWAWSGPAMRRTWPTANAPSACSSSAHWRRSPTSPSSACKKAWTKRSGAPCPRACTSSTSRHASAISATRPPC